MFFSYATTAALLHGIKPKAVFFFVLLFCGSAPDLSWSTMLWSLSLLGQGLYSFAVLRCWFPINLQHRWLLPVLQMPNIVCLLHLRYVVAT